ncbi:hypothetical protein LXL04_033407 [Taraxacum kok-saghyz]
MKANDYDYQGEYLEIFNVRKEKMEVNASSGVNAQGRMLQDTVQKDKRRSNIKKLKKGYCLFVFIRINSCRVRVWSVSCSCLIPQTRIKIRVVFVFAKFVSCKFVSDTNTRHGDTDCQKIQLHQVSENRKSTFTENIMSTPIEIEHGLLRSLPEKEVLGPNLWFRLSVHLADMY